MNSETREGSCDVIMKRIIGLIILLGVVIAGAWYGVEHYLPPGTVVYAEAELVDQEPALADGSEQLTGFDRHGNLVHIHVDQAQRRQLPQQGYLKFYYRQGKVVSVRRIPLKEVPTKALTRLSLTDQ